MGKTKTSKRLKRSSNITPKREVMTKARIKRRSSLRESNPAEELLDEGLISQAIWECLKEGDSEGVIEVIQAYLEAMNITELTQKSKLPRSTMYNTLKTKNPTIKTLAKLVHACF